MLGKNTSSAIRRKSLVYYRKAQRESAWFGKGAFKLRFLSIQQSAVNSNFITKLADLFCRNFKYQRQTAPTTEEVLKIIPPKQPDFKKYKDKINYTWIGHSTSVISVGEQANFIIDPIFSKKASIFKGFGPKRYTPPACQINELPHIDAVLVSHDHADHCDPSSLQQLQSLFRPKFFAGLDTRDIFPKDCSLEEMDWTDQRELYIKGKQFRITFVPACHWARRSLFDQNTRLWGGFVVESPKGVKIFYGGDTGYCGVFKQIGEVHGPFDLAIIPIGCYLPRQGLSCQHINPQEAVIIHKELKSKKSVGVHWGTFQSPFQHYLSAWKDLQIMKEKHHLKHEEFVAINHGQSFMIDY